MLEKVDEVFTDVSDVLHRCRSLIDSRVGRLANRLEDMSEPITDTELNQMGGAMKSFDDEHFYPVLANGAIPTWHSGCQQLYIRVDGGFQYTAILLDGEVIEYDNNRYNSDYFCPSERDFIAIDLIHESSGIFEECLELMDMIEKQSD